MESLRREWKLWALVNGIPAAAAAILLLLVPSFALDTFAWTVQPRLSAVYIGASYIFRALFFLAIFRATSWDRIRPLTWGNAIFALTLLVATFIHAERFRWSGPMAYIWLFLYIEEPLWMVFLLAKAPRPLNELQRRDTGSWQGVQALLAVEAFVLIAAGGFLFFSPEFLSPLWPWTLTPLTARVMAGWPFGFAVWMVTVALMKDWEARRLGIQLNIVWLAALLVTMLLFLTEFDLSRLPTWLYGLVITAFLASLLAIYWQQEKQAETTTIRREPTTGRSD